MSTFRTVIAALLVPRFGLRWCRRARGASDAWMNRASQTFSGGGY
jgi:hypothetical protein